MKKLAGSLFLKILSFVLVCILVPIFMGCVWCAYEAYDEGAFFERKGSFSESEICKNFVTEKLLDVDNYIYWNDITGLKKDKYFFDEKNFAYAIFDASGETVFSTVKSITNNPADNGSYIAVIEDFPTEEVDSAGNITKVYTLTGYIPKNMSPQHDGYEEYMVYKILCESTEFFVYGAIASFALGLLLIIYLIAAAGYDKEGNLDFRGLMAVDYDIFMLLSVIAFWSLMTLFYEIEFIYSAALKIAVYGLVFALITAVVLLAIYSTSVHLKTKKWWKHTFIYKSAATIKKVVFWVLGNIGITWKMAFATGAFALLIFFLTLSVRNSVLPLLLLFMVTAGAILAVMWFCVQLKKLEKAGAAIANGDFDYRTETKELWPALRRHAYNLNSAADGMSKAVEDRIKSERFKTELITNVSHDLKTPLTSIVSYVDLLKKEEIKNENAKEYIEVIERQSAKLKKLTEDLVEASKASSGAVAVSCEYLNIGELINQSVGEFSEKLEDANITPVVDIPEEEITVFTDGRLLWRVFDNLIQNIIKYAQPGTRAYFNLFREEETAVFTIKNISKDPLNMTAEALMERFVRGDASRNSEGNGLGLSIAKSLTELCGGSFELSLDGDLYKVIIKIPTANPPEVTEE